MAIEVHAPAVGDKAQAPAADGDIPAPATDSEGTANGNVPAPAPTPVPATERHPEFYKPYGNVILRVENTLFRLDRAMLSELSGLFRDMFQLPQGNLVTEGLEDNNPVWVPSDIKAEAFANLIRTAVYVMPNRWTPPPHPPQRYTDVLDLAKFLQFPNHVVEGAIHELLQYTCDKFEAADRIFYARKYNIKVFLERAFEYLCKRNLYTMQELSMDDCRKLGGSVLEVLAKVKAEIEDSRLRLAIYPPNLNFVGADENCRDHKACKRAWRDAWKNTVMPKIMDPVRCNSLRFPLQAREFLEALQVPGMFYSCRERALEFILAEDSPVLLCEKLCVDAGLAELMRRFEKGDI